MSNDLLERAQRLVNEYGAEELLSIELTNITPALVGSWNATRYTDPDSCLVEPPRPTDIAGKTRWWLRAILAAGIYEQYGLHAPTYLLDEIASQIMGSAGDKGHASKIQIVTKLLHNNQIQKACHTMSQFGRPSRIRNNLLREAEQKGIQHIVKDCDPSSPEQCCQAALLSSRVLLNLLGHEPDKIAKIPLPPGFYKFRLRILWRPNPQSKDVELEQRLLGLALGLAIFFTGIGRMATRGYGKLAPLNLNYTVYTNNPLLQEFLYVINTVLNEDEPMKELASRATCLASQYIKEFDYKRKDLFCAPLQETFHRKYVAEAVADASRIKIVGYTPKPISCNNDSWCIVAAISNFLVKNNILFKSLIKSYNLSEHIFGLPRRRKNTNIKKVQSRLISQIHFSIVGNSREPSRLIVLGFRSAITNCELVRRLGYNIRPCRKCASDEFFKDIIHQIVYYIA